MLGDETHEAMADPIDRACHIEQINTREREHHYRRLAAPEQKQIVGAGGELVWETETCVECDEPIEAGRLALAKVRCIECQSLIERRAKGL